jgi:putative two-component system response regulator
MSHVLIVDDDAAVARLLARLVREDGHEPVVVSDIEPALEALAKVPELVLMLLDVNLPGGSGLQLITRVRQSFPHLAIVMISGVDDAHIARAALDAGAYGYVLKPFRATEVRIAVMNALARRRLEQENRRHRSALEELVAERTGELRTTLELLARSNRNLMRAQEEIIRRLSIASEVRDEETGAHISRMSAYTALLAAEAGLPAHEVELLRVASPLHDVGKIGIPDAILRKPGRHSPEETEIMRQHTVIGHRTLSGTGFDLLDTAADIALSHHERWDGAGYPRALAGEAIPMAGRIVAISDVFDALTTRRIYKPAFPIERSLELMREGRGAQFDPALLDLFLARIDEVFAIRERFPDEG